jgi:xylonate dehydratase
VDLQVPGIRTAAGGPRPTVADWIRINLRVPRLVDVLPNGPTYHPTVRVFLAGGVPEVMLHLRDLGVIDTTVMTTTGETLEAVLDAWRESDRRQQFRQMLTTLDGVDPDDVIMAPARAKSRGLTSTLTFPLGNLAPQGSVIKSTSIDPSVVGADGVYRHEGPARVFVRERDAIRAIKSHQIVAGDVIVLAGCGPMGTGMEETYQLTSALKHVPYGKHVALITDARFSGVSTGACVGHIGPEALAGGPIGRLREGDRVRLVIDRNTLEGSIDLVGADGKTFSAEEGAAVLAGRSPHPDLAPADHLPADTRLWAALQQASGGTWGGAVYDADAITAALAGR